MATSLREVGTFIDPVDETPSLAHATAHHRWLETPLVASLGEMSRRHDHPDSVRLRFLWFNTFLMRVRVNLAAALAQGVTPSELMDALDVGPKDLLDNYDVCNLLPSGPDLIPFVDEPGPRDLCKAAGSPVGFVIDYFGDVDEVVDEIIDKLGGKKAMELILQIAGIPGEIVLDTKPALKARAKEIGDMLRSDGYDLAALCETWNSDLRHDLVSHWQLPDSDKHTARGVEEGEANLGDGLLFGSPGGRIVAMERFGFETRGIDRVPGLLLDMLADDELWARKGCLLAQVDVGVGVLDVYLTHLYFGTGLVGDEVAQYFGHVAPPSNEERRAVRGAQLEGLEGFIEATHDPTNIAIVCGDFNIDANGTDPDYGGLVALEQFAKNCNLQDRWVTPHGELWGATGGPFEKICAATQPNDPRFCVDTEVASGGYRIDFVFVENPTPQHSFMLDLTRVRRRPFPRQVATDGQANLSDHLGLDCTFLASPL